jgi:hypothetical protein
MPTPRRLGAPARRPVRSARPARRQAVRQVSPNASGCLLAECLEPSLRWSDPTHRLAMKLLYLRVGGPLKSGFSEGRGIATGTGVCETTSNVPNPRLMWRRRHFPPTQTPTRPSGTLPNHGSGRGAGIGSQATTSPRSGSDVDQPSSPSWLDPQGPCPTHGSRPPRCSGRAPVEPCRRRGPSRSPLRLRQRRAPHPRGQSAGDPAIAKLNCSEFKG